MKLIIHHQKQHSRVLQKLARSNGVLHRGQMRNAQGNTYESVNI